MEPADGDTLRLLLSTDNHLGYAEKDPVRGDDSFRTFREVLRLARQERVDLLLLGGDLFHENKPSRKTLYQTMSLLRQNCMGDGAVRFQVVSDQSLNFPNFGVVNYEDPNYNIELPVFSIHGNHDDPSREHGSSASGGSQTLAALDLLSAANFVNYFGKSDRADDVEVFPILVVKGNTRVAIYGLGNMRDERLHRMFAQQKVVFRRPAERPEEWFSIFVVHQNRDDRGRGSKNCLPESFIPDFIDFVLWGHEHECLVEVQESLKGEFYITQPGSSVATSLVEGEAREKRIAVLEVNGQSFRMSSRPLTTVRPFKMTDVVLSEVEELDPNDPDVADHIREYLETRVNELLDEAEVEMKHREEQQQITLPDELRQVLVRIRVEHTGFPVLVNQRFGSKFVGRVANLNDILLFHRKKRDRVSAVDKKTDKLLKESLQAPIRPRRLDTITVDDILSKNLHLPERKLVFLPEKNLAIALEDYVTKNVPSAIDEFVETVLVDTQKEMAKREDTKTKQDIVSVLEKKKEKSEAERLLQLEEEAESASAPPPAASADDSYRFQGGSSRQGASRFYADDQEDDEDSAGSSKPAAKPSRFGTARSIAPVSIPKSASTASRRESSDSDFMGDSPAKSARKKSPKKAPASKKKAPATSKASARAPPQRAPARSATRRPINELLSDDEDDEDRGLQNSQVDMSDADEDYEVDGEEESEVTESLPPSSRHSAASGKGKAKKITAGAGRKRLRQSATTTTDDDNDDDLPRSAKKRPAPSARGKAATVENEVDLVSSNESEPSEPPRTHESKRSAPPLPRARPQPKINEMFARQAASQSQLKQPTQVDELESDTDFTQLTGTTAASAVPATQQPNRLRGAAAWQGESQSDMSQSQSQAFGGVVGANAKRRKLPLSMVASQSGGGGAARKGWGRTRR